MKRKKLTIALVASTLALVLMLTTLSVYAYFSTQVYVYTDTGREVAKVGMNLQLLFGKLTGVETGTDLKIPSYNVVDANGAVVKPANKSYWANVAGEGQYLHFNDGVTDTTKYDPSAPWGSAQNPYVISEARHMQNLSALQSVGYFDLLYIRNNFKNGAYAAGSATIPYFVVCNVDGTPVTIDGSDLDPIKPIGSAEHPFIGVIGGAFAAGETTVAGKTSSVSAINGFKIQTNTNQTDVGLFGYIGYLGSEPTENVTADSTFTGCVSVIQNILLSDVQVTVKNPTIAEVASSLLGHVFNNHRFSFTGNSDAQAGVPPHEDHHIGIFAGHISYAHAQNISVYYSTDNVCAIDLTHVKGANDAAVSTNYHSSTGIVGFMHNMDSPVKNKTDDTGAYNNHCQVSYGGVSSSGINLIPDGIGAGGGKGFGSGRGYVLAKNLYESTHFITANQGMGDRAWKYKHPTTGDWNYAMMLFQTAPNGGYKDIYGNTATVNKEAGTATANGITYTSIVLRNIVEGTDANSYKYQDVLNDGTIIWDQLTEEAKEANNQMYIFEDEVCCEISQTIWQYVTEKPENTANTVWADAVVVYETDEATGQYTLEDMTTAVTIGDANGDGTYKATMTNVAIYSDTAKRPAISRVICLRMQSDGSYKCSLTATGNMNEPYLYRSKPLVIANAQNMTGDKLCVLADEGISLGGGDAYYFYDGAFTFALSSPQDTIESTWENNTPDQIVLGNNNDGDWVANTTYGNKATVAYVKQIMNKGALDDRIALNNDDDPNNDRDIFVLYQTGDGGIFLMTLYNTSTDNLTSIFDTSHWGANRYTTNGTSLSFANQALTDSIVETLRGDNEYSLDENIIQQIESGDMKVINLGTSSDANIMATLEAQYRIKFDLSGSSYRISGVTGNGGSIRSLSMIYRDAFLVGDSYSIFCGTESEMKSVSDDNIYTMDASLEEVSGGAFRIKFQYGDATPQYVTYKTVSQKSVFGSTETVDAGCVLYFYEVEPVMHNMDFGHITFEPADGKTNLSFDADEYILWPNAVMDQDGTFFTEDWNTSTNSFATTYVEAGTTNGNVYHDATVTQSNGGGNTVDPYRTYKLVSLQTLTNGDAGWQDGRGNKLSIESLHQKFTMQQSISFSASIKPPIFNLPNLQLNNGTVLAPVGPDRTFANVPTGCIAFRIPEAGEKKIRVIVSVPLSKYYDGYKVEGTDEIVGLATDVDYYLGLWKTENLSSEGSWEITTFSQSSAELKFEVPRSRPYAPGTTASGAEYILVEHNNTTYRCYLNGDRILVGYEFVVSEAGTYILGTAVGESSLLSDSGHGYPMEIVYCAADGMASAGRDGTSGSAIGALDYVYDHNGKIVHVQDYAPTVTVTPGDFNYYFNSRIITHTVNNDTTAINTLQLWPRRYVDTNDNTSKILIYTSDGTLLDVKRMGAETDKVTIQTGTPPANNQSSDQNQQPTQ